MLDDVEDQREYFGLDLGRLMCVVKEAKKYVTLERQGQNLTEKVQNTHVSEWLAAKVKWSDPKRCPSAATLGQLLQISNGLAQAPRSWQITMPTGKTHPHYTHWLAEAQKMRRSEKKRQTEFQQDLSIMYIQ
jgi:hypothetical protein